MKPAPGGDPRKRLQSASPFEERYGFSRALRVGDRIEVAGTAPIPQDGSAVPPSAYEQMRLCASIALHAIESLGGRFEDVVRTRMFVVDAADADEIGRAHGDAFGAARPVATMVVVAGLLDPAWRVEIEVEAIVAPE
ncbi:MAG: RidA family protein [Planctomycetes bacterium]|nr:RidA family protein [Planctomycetota bacterium]